MATAADTLLKLLDKVPDADQLEMMLEAENLVQILEGQGQSRDDIKAKLQQGAKPGELLLDALDREPDVDKLMQGVNVVPVASSKPKTRVVSSTKNDPTVKSGGSNRWGMALVVGLIVALVFGGIFGFLSAQVSWVIGAVAALFAGLVICLSMIPFLLKRDSSTYMGMLPLGALLAAVAIFLIVLTPLVLAGLNEDAGLVDSLRLAWTFLGAVISEPGSSLITIVAGTIGFVFSFIGSVRKMFFGK